MEILEVRHVEIVSVLFMEHFWKKYEGWYEMLVRDCEDNLNLNVKRDRNEMKQLYLLLIV